MSGDDLAAWLRGVGVCLALLLPACAAAPLAGAQSPGVAIGVADVSAAPDPLGAPAARGGALRSKNDPFGMTGFDSDQPLSIHSDELEASQTGGARRLVFSKNVKVEQGDLQLESARLEAFYPENASQPDRLVASGDVHVVQGTREARCDEAIYYRTEDLSGVRGPCRASRWRRSRRRRGDRVRPRGGAGAGEGGRHGAVPPGAGEAAGPQPVAMPAPAPAVVAP